MAGTRKISLPPRCQGNRHIGLKPASSSSKSNCTVLGSLEAAAAERHPVVIPSVKIEAIPRVKNRFIVEPPLKFPLFRGHIYFDARREVLCWDSV